LHPPASQHPPDAYHSRYAHNTRNSNHPVSFAGFQAYATALPELVVTGKNVPDAKTKLKVALQNLLRMGCQPVLPARTTYHIVY
jgi:hypothetical protein